MMVQNKKIRSYRVKRTNTMVIILPSYTIIISLIMIVNEQQHTKPLNFKFWTKRI